MGNGSGTDVEAGENRGSPVFDDAVKIITLAEFTAIIEEVVRRYNADDQVNGSVPWPRRTRARTSVFRPTRRGQPGLAS